MRVAESDSVELLVLQLMGVVLTCGPYIGVRRTNQTMQSVESLAAR